MLTIRYVLTIKKIKYIYIYICIKVAYSNINKLEYHDDLSLYKSYSLYILLAYAAGTIWWLPFFY